MTRGDSLLRRLEHVNPVPDPTQLYEDLEAPRQHYLADEQRRNETMPDNKIDQLDTRRQGPRVRRGLLIGATAAALVLIVGLAYNFFGADEESDVFGGDSRVLQLSFDGEQCLYDGPDALSPGEVEVGLHNLSAERVWADFVRLDDDRTIQDVVDFMADPASSGRPAWTRRVWSINSLGANASSQPAVRTVEPGLHVLVCGTWSPYVGYFGAELPVE